MSGNDFKPRRKCEGRLQVAIIGGGPAGLGLAIELANLPFVDWDLYEKKPMISETGGGISLQPTALRLLENNGAAEYITPTDIYRSSEGKLEQRRNGRTGELLMEESCQEGIPLKYQSCRMARSKLQTALLTSVNRAHIHVSKRLVDIQHTEDNRVRIFFEDGFSDEVDLLVAADGLRSIIREKAFPDHVPEFNGQSAYRTIVSKAEAAKIKELPFAQVFWEHISGAWVMTCPLGDDDFEVTARIRRTREGEDPKSWGRPFDLNELLKEYEDFCLPVRQILQLAAKGQTQEFDMFSSRRLDSVISHGCIAFIGDAAHPMLGNFGSGAAFALQDVYTLAKVLESSMQRSMALSDALIKFDSIRSPFYQRLYRVLNKFSEVKSVAQTEEGSIDERISRHVLRMSQAAETWMIYYRIDEEVAQALSETDVNAVHTRPISRVRQFLEALGVLRRRPC
ncbi:unnamed protein product [Clonostachys solani]|uniref:FAD-binding domain-containing protein n=1 Tax=Clonostachys solani TaxID=160281 RepID=A0A9N9W800_9HYPO|nr:unnamed protein product [Clonostachys solani]